MNKDIMRVGIVGAGANTRLRHIPGLQEIQGVSVDAVCNRSRASSEAVAEEFEIPRIFDTWEDLVSDPDLDAVVIGTWPYLHKAVTCAALDAGKHVMTEARMARNLAEANQMLETSRAHPELICQVVPAPFSLGVDAAIQRLLRDGYIGDLRFVEHRTASGFLPESQPMQWRLDPELSGKNIMMLGIVYEMIMRWVGPASSVYAEGSLYPQKLITESGETVEPTMPHHLDVLARLAGGAQLHLQQSQVTPFLAGEGTWLYGSEGVIRFHDGSLTGAKAGESGLQPLEIKETERVGWRVEAEFIGAIRGEEEIRLTSFADGVRYMEFTEAVHDSLASKRAVSLPYSGA